MIKVIGVILISLAVWQLIVAIRIGRIARSEIPDQERQARIQSLNRASKMVQFVALVGAAIFIFMEV